MPYLPFVIGHVLLTFLAVVRHGECQCGGIKTGQRGEIESPSYPSPKQATCNWVFKPNPNGNNYLLMLTVKKLRLNKERAKTCSESYTLDIDGDRINCSVSVNDPEYTIGYCYAFYGSDECKNVGAANLCPHSKTTLSLSPISVTYTSDGTGIRPMGFKMSYRFIQCPKGNQIGWSSSISVEKEVSEMKGIIQSPNFGNELGKSAHIRWMLKPPPSEEKQYGLKLEVQELSLFYRNRETGEIYCSESYSLSILGNVVDCTEVVGIHGVNPYCVFYYSSPSCENVAEAKTCRLSEKINYPMLVEYNADGGSKEGDFAYVKGFKVKYEFIQCQLPTTNSRTTDPSAKFSTTLATSSVQETPRSTSSIIGISQGNKDANLAETSTSTSNTKITTRKTKPGRRKVAEENTVSTGTHGVVDENDTAQLDKTTIVAAIIAVVLFLLLIAFVIIIRMRRKCGVKVINNSYATNERNNVYGENAASPLEPATRSRTTSNHIYSEINDPLREPATASTINRSEAPAYFAIDEDAELDLSEQTPQVQVDTVKQAQGILYSAVDTASDGEKETVRYKKSLVNNVLYEPCA